MISARAVLSVPFPMRCHHQNSATLCGTVSLAPPTSPALLKAILGHRPGDLGILADRVRDLVRFPPGDARASLVPNNKSVRACCASCSCGHREGVSASRRSLRPSALSPFPRPELLAGGASNAWPLRYVLIFVVHPVFHESLPHCPLLRWVRWEPAEGFGVGFA